MTPADALILALLLAAAVAALLLVAATEPGALARGLHRWTYHGHHTHHHTHGGTAC